MDRRTRAGRRAIVQQSLACQACSAELIPVCLDHAQLTPCNHIICMPCLANSLAARVPSSFAQCPVVSCSKFHGHALRLFKGTEDLTEYPIVNQSNPVRDIINDPSREKDPVRFFFKNRGEVGNDSVSNQGILFLARSVYSKALSRRVFATNTAYFDLNIQAFSSDDDWKEAEKIFMALNFLLPTRNIRQTKAKSLLPDQLVRYALNDDNKLLSILYAMVHRKPLTNEVRNFLASPQNHYACSDFLACFGAKELLSSANQYNAVSTLQTSIGDYCHSMGASDDMLRLLSKFRLAGSVSYLDRKAMQASIDQLDQTSLSPWDLVVYCYDNLGFTKKGLRATKEQWTVLSIAIIPVEQLKKLGFYATNSANQIPRTSRTLDQIKADCNNDIESFLQRIFGCREEDYEELSFYSLCHIETVIKLRLPDGNQCQQYLRDEQFNDCHTMIPRNLGIDVHPRQREFDNHGYPIPLKTRRFVPGNSFDDYISPGADNSGTTLFARNNVFVDIPLKQDLASTATVKGYSDDVFLPVQQEQCQGAANRANIDHSEPPLAELIIPIAADNSPIYTLNRLIDEDSHGAKEYCSLRPFPGGFHMMKEVISCMGSLMKAFRVPFLELYRSSHAGQQFNLDPHDPNQFEEEAIPYIAAQYSSAVDAYAKENPLLQSFSASEVHEMMLRRARKYPTALAVLADLRFHEIYFILRDAERSGDSEKFFRGVRLALPLFAASHAVRYVRTCCDLLVWRARASPAELVIFESFAFTRITTTGKLIYIDRMQEKINLFFRERIGHVVRPAHDAKMLSLALGIGDFSEKKQSVKAADGISVAKPSPPFNEQTVPVGEVFISVRTKLGAMQLWEESNDLLVGMNGDSMRAADENICLCPNGNLIRSIIVRQWSIGSTRVESYGRKFYVDSINSVARPEKLPEGVPLHRLPTQKEDFDAHGARRTILATSVVKSDLISASQKRKEPLLLEINRLRDQIDNLPVNVNFDSIRNKTVAELAELLIQLRSIFFDECQRKGVDITALLQDLSHRASTEEAYSDPLIRNGEIDNFFYKLIAGTVDEFRVAVRYN